MWLSQLSIRLLISAQVMTSGSPDQAPSLALCSGRVCLRFSLSPSARPPTHICYLFQINKTLKKKSDSRRNSKGICFACNVGEITLIHCSLRTFQKFPLLLHGCPLLCVFKDDMRFKPLRLNIR